MPKLTPRQIAREFVADLSNCTQDYAENTDGIAIDTLEEMIQAALKEQRERDAVIAYNRLVTLPKLAQEVCAAIRRGDDNN